MIERQREQTPAGFLFAAKLTRTLTHEIDPGHGRNKRPRFATASRRFTSPGNWRRSSCNCPPPSIGPAPSEISERALRGAGRAALGGGVPPRYLAADAVYAELARRRITLVAVDEPSLPGLLPPVEVVTIRACFTYVFTGAMPAVGGPAICSSNLIMITRTRNCGNGWSASPECRRGPGRECCFSTTTSTRSAVKTPGG